MQANKTTKKMHKIIDLEACYDRQLLNTCSTVQESIGSDRNAIKLICKKIKNF